MQTMPDNASQYPIQSLFNVYIEFNDNSGTSMQCMARHRHNTAHLYHYNCIRKV